MKYNTIKVVTGKSILVFFLSFLAIFNSSCKKVLESESVHASPESLQWKSIADTRSALFGIYGLFRAALADNNAHWMYGEMRMGDFQPYNRMDLKAISQHNLKAAYPLLDDLSDWRRFYAVINAASVFIEHAPQVNQIDPLYSDLNLRYDIAQARALRAFSYFYMARIWGDVPLITEAYDNGSFPSFPKASQQAVLNYAENELLAASINLPYRYGVSPQVYYNQNAGFWDGILINKISAYAILSHIAAWRGNYVNAEVYTKFVLDNYTNTGASFSNITNLTSVNGIFSRRSPAQLVAFSFMDANRESTRTGHIEDLTLAQPWVIREKPQIYVPKDSIAVIFTDPNDLRFGVDTFTNTYRTNYFSSFNSEVPVFSKIKVIRDGVTDPSFSIFGSVILFTRLEEVMLLRAEALAALNRIDEAIIALNNIRSARGLPLYIREDEDNVLDFIFAERRRELMGEGWRWYDQIRYQRLRQHDPAFELMMSNKGIYWPVSARVLAANSLLIQNNYWN